MRQFGSKAPIAVIENGVDTGQFSLSEANAVAVKRHRVVFVGAMDYHANIDGAVFFAREVWPQVAARLPDAVFTIVGRNPSEAVSLLARGGAALKLQAPCPDVPPCYSPLSLR